MILTLTANPSLDRTIELPGPVLRGQVQRAVWAGQQPGGKGVNVSRAVAAADRDTLAVLPGDVDDPVLTGLDAIGLAHRSIPTGTPLRSNITVTEPDGTTTKINEPGSLLSPQSQNALLDLVADQAAGASWVVLAGSLPPGVDDDFYARAIERIRELDEPPLIAVDTSGAPLAAALTASPDLIKPNAEELAELLSAAGLLRAAGLLNAGGPRDDARADSDRGATESFEAAELRKTAEAHESAAPSKPQTCSRSPGAWNPHRSSQPAPHRLCSRQAAPTHDRSWQLWAPVEQSSPSRRPRGMPSIRRWTLSAPWAQAIPPWPGTCSD